MTELTNSIATPKRGRPVFTHDNRFVRQWLYRYSTSLPLEDGLLLPFKVPSIYELPSWCNDCWSCKVEQFREVHRKTIKYNTHHQATHGFPQADQCQCEGVPRVSNGRHCQQAIRESAK